MYPIPAPQIGTDFGFFFNEGQIDPLKQNSAGLLADVVFTFADDKKQCAHSQILSARSPVFLKLFGSAFKESQNEKRIVQIPIVDVPYRTFIEVMRFIYCGKVDWSVLVNDIQKNTKKRQSHQIIGDLDSASTEYFDPYKKRKTKSNDLYSKSLDAPCPIASSVTRPHSARPFSAEADISSESGETEGVNDDCEEALDISSNEEIGMDTKFLATVDKSETQMDSLNHALSLYEAADKYELNRLRLLAEHKALQILRDQINRINLQVKNGLKHVPFSLHSSFAKVYGKTRGGSRMLPTTFENPTEALLRFFRTEDPAILKDKQKVWCNGFLDVMALADRHNSKRLKRLCLSALTADSLTKTTKKILLSNELLYSLDKTLITEMLQFVAIREQREVDEDTGIPEFGTFGGVPEGGKELLDEREAEELDGCEEREPSSMQEAELKSELVERGFPVRGNRATLVSRLEEARGLRLSQYLKAQSRKQESR